MGNENFYEILGLNSSGAATQDEIKRAYVKKRKEYQGNEEKTSLLNEAYSVLADEEKRRNYDYDIEKSIVMEELDNLKNFEERKEALCKLKKVCEKHLGHDDERDLSEYQTLIEIERSIGKDDVIPYLDKMWQILDEKMEVSEQYQWYEYVGNNYYLYDDVDGAIKAYFQIYKAAVPKYEITEKLISLLCNEKKKPKTAIKILKDCIDRSDIQNHKCLYLCKAYEVVASIQDDTFDKVKMTLKNKISTLVKVDQTNEITIHVLCDILTCMGYALENKSFSAYHDLEQIYLAKGINNLDIKYLYNLVKQSETVIVNNKQHECIELLSEDLLTDKMRRKIEDALINDLENVMESITFIEENAPLIVEQKFEVYNFIDSVVTQQYKALKEYSQFIKDSHFGDAIKTILRRYLFKDVIRYATIEDDFNKAINQFYDDNNLNQTREEIRMLDRLYPNCYKLLAEYLFDGQSVAELLGDDELGQTDSSRSVANNKAIVDYPHARKGYENRPFYSGFLEMIIILVATVIFPPTLPIVLVIKTFNRYTKIIIKVAIGIIVAVALLLIISSISSLF